MTEEVINVKKELLKGGGARIFSIIFRKGVGFIKVIIFARLFMPDDVGTALLAIAAAEFVSWIAGVGLPEYAIAKGKSKEAINTSFTLSVILSGFTLIVFLGIIPFASGWIGSEKDLSLYMLMGFYVIFTVPAMFPMNILLRDLKFEKAALPQMISELSAVIFAIGVYFIFKNGVISIITGQALGFTVSSILLWTITKDRPKFQINKEIVKSALSYAWPLSLKNFSNVLLRKTETIVISKFYGTIDNAYFNYANNLVENVNQFIIQITSMIFPILTRVQEDEERLKRWYYLSVKISAGIGIPAGIFFFLFADPLVRLLYGEKWLEIIPVLKILGIAYAIRMIFGDVPGYLAYLNGRTKYILVWSLIHSVSKIVIGTILIIKFGILGAAYYYLIFYNLLAMVSTLYINNSVLKSFAFLKHIVKPVSFGVITLFIYYSVMMYLSHNVYLMITLMGLFALTQLLLYYLFDKEVVKLFLNR